MKVVLNKKGKTSQILTLKCESDSDYRLMVENMPVNYLITLPPNVLKEQLKKMRLGVFRMSEEKAKRKYIAGLAPDLTVYLSNLEHHILDILSTEGRLKRLDLVLYCNRAHSTMNDNLNRLITRGFVQKLYINDNKPSKSPIYFQINEPGRLYLKDHKTNTDKHT